MAVEGRVRLKFATGRTITLTLGEYEELRKMLGVPAKEAMQGVWHNWPYTNDPLLNAFPYKWVEKVRRQEEEGAEPYVVGDNPDLEPKITCEGN